MFSVYGVGGQLFRGSMDQLRQIGSVSASARSHAIRALGRDGDDPSDAAGFSGPAVRATGEEAQRSALSAYAQSQKVTLLRHPLKRVDALMSREVITVPDSVTVLEAWRMLAERGIGQAPVVNATSILVGLLCRADLLHPDNLPTPDHSAVAWRALLARNVSDLMRTPVPCVAPDTDIRHVARVLLDSALPGLAVIDEQGQVIGFVSRSDILRAVVTDPPLDLWG